MSRRYGVSEFEDEFESEFEDEFEDEFESEFEFEGEFETRLSRFTEALRNYDPTGGGAFRPSAERLESWDSYRKRMGDGRGTRTPQPTVRIPIHPGPRIDFRRPPRTVAINRCPPESSGLRPRDLRPGERREFRSAQPILPCEIVRVDIVTNAAGRADRIPVPARGFVVRRLGGDRWQVSHGPFLGARASGGRRTRRTRRRRESEGEFEGGEFQYEGGAARFRRALVNNTRRLAGLPPLPPLPPAPPPAPPPRQSQPSVRIPVHPGPRVDFRRPPRMFRVNRCPPASWGTRPPQVEPGRPQEFDPSGNRVPCEIDRVEVVTNAGRTEFIPLPRSGYVVRRMRGGMWQVSVDPFAGARATASGGRRR